MIRVLQFADIINRYDFIDNLVQFADPERFDLSVCLRSEEHPIAAPQFPERTKYRLLPGLARRDWPRTARRLAATLREWEIDVLHAHHFDQAVIAWLATRLYPRTKLIVGRHYSDLVRTLPTAKRAFYLTLEQIVNRGAARLIVPSHYIFEILTERQGISAEKIDVIWYGFVAEKYVSLTEDKIEFVRQELNLDGKFVVASFGKLTRGKGVNFLAEAIVRLKDKIPNLVALFVGEGDERAALENLIARHDLQEKIKLLGWRSDAMTVMANADLVVQPTLSEAFSQVMGEAMWLQKPLVITDVSGATDVIRDEENGLLVPKADAAALAAAIEKLFSNESLRNKIAAAGRAFVEENLIIEKKIKEYEAAFLKAAGAR
jgi:L-malate glycosyltransferase